jgi:hypothetical protein
MHGSAQGSTVGIQTRMIYLNSNIGWRTANLSSFSSKTWKNGTDSQRFMDDVVSLDILLTKKSKSS